MMAWGSKLNELGPSPRSTLSPYFFQFIYTDGSVQSSLLLVGLVVLSLAGLGCAIAPTFGLLLGVYPSRTNTGVQALALGTRFFIKH